MLFEVKKCLLLLAVLVVAVCDGGFASGSNSSASLYKDVLTVLSELYSKQVATCIQWLKQKHKNEKYYLCAEGEGGINHYNILRFED